MTPLGVVFLFMLVNWWVEKHQLFYSTFTNVFFIFFSGTFFTSMPWLTLSVASVRCGRGRARSTTRKPSARRRRMTTEYVRREGPSQGQTVDTVV